jgi:hypothetical protein
MDFDGLYWDDIILSLPSGNSLHSAIENDHRNSGFFPLKMVIFHSYVSLPEGNFITTPLWLKPVTVLSEPLEECCRPRRSIGRPNVPQRF